MPVIARHCERPQSCCQRADAKPKPIVRHILFVFVVIISIAEILMAASVKAKEVDVELTIRQVIPAPFRCFRTSEPLFFCRHEYSPGHSIILDLSSNLDGASASLTYNFDDRRRHELLGIMRHFFLGLRIPAQAYDECISQAEWQRESILMPNFRVLCHRVELGDRVTYEIFAMFSNGSPTIVYANESEQ